MLFHMEFSYSKHKLFDVYRVDLNHYEISKLKKSIYISIIHAFMEQNVYSYIKHNYPSSFEIIYFNEKQKK